MAAKAAAVESHQRQTKKSTITGRKFLEIKNQSQTKPPRCSVCKKFMGTSGNLIPTTTALIATVRTLGTMETVCDGCFAKARIEYEKIKGAMV